MERERPEYLPPIQPQRWSFPWMLAIGLTILVLAGFGIKQHLETQAAWHARFASPKTPAPAPAQSPSQAEIEAMRSEQIQRIHEIREQAEQALQEREKERRTWRCINGMPFRQIPGGWENVPGERC